MRRIAFTVLALLGLSLLQGPSKAQIVGPFVQATCNQIQNVTVTAGTVQINGAAGKIIYLCGYQMTAAAAGPTFTLSYGTAANCASGTAITGAINIGTTPTTDHMQYAYFSVPQVQPFATATQNNLCVTTTGTAVVGQIYFGQY